MEQKQIVERLEKIVFPGLQATGNDFVEYGFKPEYTRALAELQKLKEELKGEFEGQVSVSEVRQDMVGAPRRVRRNV